MNKPGKVISGAALVVAVVAGVAVNVGANAFKTPSQTELDAEHARVARDIEALRQGKGRTLNAGAESWVMIWWNCQFRFVKQRRVPVELESPGSPGGKSIIHHVTTTNAEILAQLGPQDARCLDARSSEEENRAASAELDRRNATPPELVQLANRRP